MALLQIEINYIESAIFPLIYAGRDNISIRVVEKDLVGNFKLHCIFLDESPHMLRSYNLSLINSLRLQCDYDLITIQSLRPILNIMCILEKET